MSAQLLRTDLAFLIEGFARNRNIFHAVCPKLNTARGRWRVHGPHFLFTSLFYCFPLLWSAFRHFVLDQCATAFAIRFIYCLFTGSYSHPSVSRAKHCCLSALPYYAIPFCFVACANIFSGWLRDAIHTVSGNKTFLIGIHNKDLFVLVIRLAWEYYIYCLQTRKGFRELAFPRRSEGRQSHYDVNPWWIDRPGLVLF